MARTSPGSDSELPGNGTSKTPSLPGSIDSTAFSMPGSASALPSTNRYDRIPSSASTPLPGSSPSVGEP